MKPRPSIKFTIRIPIPLAVDELIEKTKYAFKKVALKMRPYRCECCNKKMYLNHSQYEHTFDNHQRLMVENNKNVCRECLVDILSTKEWSPRFTQMALQRKRDGDSSDARWNYRFWSTKKCAITGNEVRSYKDVEIHPYVDMMFCTIAWNHDYVSKEAVIECVKHGKVRTSRWGVWNKSRMAPMNNKGLFVDENGELL